MLHPALRRLLRAQASAKWRRLTRAFSCRRRFYLSILAVVLAAVWLGNVALSVLFREPTEPTRFARLVPVGFLVYGLWHLIKASFKRPEEAIEWTSAEREWLCAGPFTRRDLVLYRLAGIANATWIKAACFAILMLPDLSSPWAGFVGALLALLFLDLLRLAIEITAFSLDARSYHRWRLAAAILVSGALVSTLVIAFSAPDDWRSTTTPLSLSLMMHVLSSSASLLDTLVGQALLLPFELFAQLIVSPSQDASWGLMLSVCLGLVIAMGSLVLYLDRFFERTVRAREQREYPLQAFAANEPADAVGAGSPISPNRPRIWWLRGAGPIMWRQLRGAYKQRSSLAVAMALPGALALLPVVICRDGRQALLHVSAALTFYSFLLLPTALKFDFRRDIQRMAILKTLPIRPVALVLGQIATPALLALGFQAAVLLVTLGLCPYPVWMLLATLLLLAPLNTLIFAVDNLVYLLYPYRLNQEGIEIFLRTTLTFTAKGLLFTAGLVLTFLWSFAAHQIAGALPRGLDDAAIVFVLGGGILLAASTACIVLLLARAYLRFDPSQDTPA